MTNSTKQVTITIPHWALLASMSICVIATGAVITLAFLNQEFKLLAIPYPLSIFHLTHLGLTLAVLSYSFIVWFWYRITRKRISELLSGSKLKKLTANSWEKLANLTSIPPARTLPQQSQQNFQITEACKNGFYYWWVALPILTHLFSSLMLLIMFRWKEIALPENYSSITSKTAIFGAEYLVCMLLTFAAYFLFVSRCNRIHELLNSAVSARAESNFQTNIDRYEDFDIARAQQAVNAVNQPFHEPVQENAANGNHREF